MTTSRREEALKLAEELLTDIELAQMAPIDVARKSSRLARLLDDTDALAWLRYEVSGYPAPLDERATAAASRSNRQAPPAADGSPLWWTADLAALAAQSESALTELGTPEGGSNPGGELNAWAVNLYREKAQRRSGLQEVISARRSLIQRIVGSFHDYAAEKYQELRFGAAVETAFEVVRSEVDARISALVPDALPKLSAAFENTTSSNPEHWASAAATCRRLLKAAADALRPAGPEKDGRSMDDDHYINRLVDWIVQSAKSETAADLVASDLEFLGRRLDAVFDAGHKGAHAEVSRFDASRFVTGTYLLLGDLLRIADV